MDIEAGFWNRGLEGEQDVHERLPQLGEQRIVYIESEHVLVSKESCLVFWYPPYAQFNGWDLNPNEIRGTQVIECSLTELESYPFSDELINDFVDQGIVPDDARKYQAQVIAVTPFLEFCKNCVSTDKFAFMRCGQPDGSSLMLWEMTDGCDSAMLNDSLLFLSGSLPEQGVCAVIEILNGRYFVKFHAHYDPSMDERVAVNYELKGEELRFFKAAIDNAVDLDILLYPR